MTKLVSSAYTCKFAPNIHENVFGERLDEWFCSVHICNLHIKCHCLLHVVCFMFWFVLPNAWEKSAHSTALSDVTAAFVWGENARVETFQLHWPQPPFHFRFSHIWRQRRIWIIGTVMSAKFGTVSLSVLLWGKRSAPLFCKTRQGHSVTNSASECGLCNSHVRFWTMTI